MLFKVHIESSLLTLHSIHFHSSYHFCYIFLFVTLSLFCLFFTSTYIRFVGNSTCLLYKLIFTKIIRLLNKNLYNLVFSRIFAWFCRFLPLTFVEDRKIQQQQQYTMLSWARNTSAYLVSLECYSEMHC